MISLIVDNCAALKKKDYLLTGMDFSWYYLDNGSGDKDRLLSPLPLLDYRSSGGESQAFNPEKKGDFFICIKKIFIISS
ncbi:MAG: hypothetical protein ACM65L_24865 [Microcoleus sp.]